MNYRADIDGLRAVAVMAVVLYHAGLSSLISGGFVGVDIFFVISGYLIGKIILQELDKGDFSIAKFYARRFRRIVPALSVMLAFTTLASIVVIYPVQLVEYGKSLAAASLSVANIYFWFTSNYFDTTSEMKPLLHTWSLAVEEQFYILLPPLLIITYRYARKYMVVVIATIAFISLFTSFLGTFYFPTATFYLLHTRAWELLLGVLLAMAPRLGQGSVVVRQTLSLIGAALIAGSALLLSKATPFPGLAALPPCLGAALIIATGGKGDTVVGRLLSLWPITFLGKISYSLYLWHWPLIVLYRFETGDQTSPAIKLALVGVSIVLATLSWWFVERPFRQDRWSQKTVFRASAVALATPVVVGVALVAAGGLPTRFSSEVTRLAGFLDYPTEKGFRTGTCFLSSSFEFDDFDPNPCMARDSGRQNFLLLGDSHGAHLWWGLSRVLNKTNVMQATASGCRPTIPHAKDDEHRCTRLMDYAFGEYLQKERVDLVILAGRWTSDDLPRLAETLDLLRARGVPVLVAGPVVEYEAALPQVLAKLSKAGEQHVPAAMVSPDPKDVDQKLASLTAAKGTPYASVFKALCSHVECDVLTPHGIPVQFDYGHLTREGSVLVAGRLAEQGLLRAPVKTPPPAS